MIGRAVRRALLLVVLAVLVLFVVADRLTQSAAAHALSVQARQTGQLAGDPSVSIGGFPFLTQALHGRYRDIEVTTHGIHRGGLRLDTVSARFRGVHVGLTTMLDGRIGRVPIDAASGDVVVTYPDLDALLTRRHLVVSADGAALLVSGPVAIAGQRATVAGPVTVTVTGGVLVLAPSATTLRVVSGGLTAAAVRTAAATLTVRVPLAALPFGLTLRTVTVLPTELRLDGSAVGPTVRVPADASVT